MKLKIGPITPPARYICIFTRLLHKNTPNAIILPLSQFFTYMAGGVYAYIQETKRRRCASGDARGQNHQSNDHSFF